MNENKFLNEEKYQKAEKSISLIAVLVLIIGLSFGGFLIYRGIAKPASSKVEELRVQLETKKNELESKGIVYSRTAQYTDAEAYDLKIITGALDPSFPNCEFDEYKNNSLTREYCKAQNSIDEFATTSSIMFGVFICIASCMISFAIFMFAKRRHILAFQAQQVIPVAKEGINEMAPAAGTVAGEITKGIMKNVTKDKVKCPECDGFIDEDSTFCEHCGKKL